jgi:glycosyltransferase involved in cell wall biosynthesis
VLEGLSCGLPVACYPVKGPADLVEDGVNGLVCKDSADMAEPIVGYLAGGAEKRESFRHRALGTALRYQAGDIMDRMMVDVGMG